MVSKTQDSGAMMTWSYKRANYLLLSTRSTVHRGPFRFELMVDDGMALRRDTTIDWMSCIYRAFDGDLVEVGALYDAEPQGFIEKVDERLDAAYRHYEAITQQMLTGECDDQANE